MNRKIITFIFLISAFSLFKGQSGGQLIKIYIDSHSLGNSLVDNFETKKIAVYLPPSYSDTIAKKHYPVVYFLTGYGDCIDLYLNGSFSGFFLNYSMNILINNGTIKEMIFVLIDGVNLMDGSFYENSPVTGNWRDWVAEDVVNYIDYHYRTIRKRESRAICGHSMGGFGAINIGMRNSDTFGLVYALSPGLFDLNGLKYQGMFSNEGTIRSSIARMDGWKNMGSSQALADFKSYIQTEKQGGNWFTCFTYGYGAAFSPDPNANPPFIKYPYYLENNVLKCDSAILKNYENGFGGLASKVTKFKNNFLSLIDFTIDYGINDSYGWICSGCKYMSQLLTAQNIPHQLVSFDGGHQDQLRSRIEQFMLPRLSAKFEYEEPSAVDERKGILNDYRLFQNYPNPFNPATSIEYSVPDIEMVTLNVYDILGRKAATLVNEVQQAGSYNIQLSTNNYRLTSGVYFYRLTAGNYSATRKMIVMK